MDAKKRNNLLLLGGAVVVALACAFFMERQREEAVQEHQRAVAAPAVGPAAATDPTKPVVTSGKDSTELQQAEAQAQQSLPQFWGMMAGAPEGVSGYALKVRFDNPHGGADYMWVSDLKRDGDRISGRLADEPDNNPALHRGMVVQVTPDRISDWTFFAGGKAFGQYTTRALAKNMPAADAARLTATLSKAPLSDPGGPQP